MDIAGGKCVRAGGGRRQEDGGTRIAGRSGEDHFVSAGARGHDGERVVPEGVDIEDSGEDSGGRIPEVDHVTRVLFLLCFFLSEFAECL